MPEHESTGATPGPKAHELVRFYIDTLEDLMDPKEYMDLMGILGSGRMDQQIVEVGDGSRTVVDSETAADPEALRTFCAQVRERNQLRQEERDALNGIEAAST